MNRARALLGMAVALCGCGTSDVFVGSDVPLVEPAAAGAGSGVPAGSAGSTPPVVIVPPAAVDASVAALDAGTGIAVDAGSLLVDAGAPDTGAPVVDAGSADAGVRSVDAGSPDTGPPLTCPSGFDDCDGDPTNGCEHDVRDDDDHCGACGVVCPSSAPSSSGSSCVDGTCVLTCSLLQADCDGDLTNGCEANLWISSDNCGACGVVCLCHDGRCL